MSPLPCNGRPVRPATRPGNAPSAFTLVELLVVVSVIGLLVAILVPSLSVARKQARAVLCLSRCRALGVGMNMYLNEFGAFPAHQLRMRDFDPTLVEDVRFRWFDAMALELSSGTLMRPRDMANAEWEQVRRDNLFFDVQTCPSTKQWEVGRNNAYGYNYKYLGSARTSLNTANRHRPYECYPIQGVRAPADTIAFADCDGTGWTKPWAPEKPRGDHDPSAWAITATSSTPPISRSGHPTPSAERSTNRTPGPIGAPTSPIATWANRAASLPTVTANRSTR